MYKSAYVCGKTPFDAHSATHLHSNIYFINYHHLSTKFVGKKCYSACWNGIVPSMNAKFSSITKQYCIYILYLKYQICHFNLITQT